MIETSFRARIAEYLGEKIRRRRLALGYSLMALAKEVGSHASTLSRIESGKLLPSEDLAKKLFRALKLEEKISFDEAMEIYREIRQKIEQSESAGPGFDLEAEEQELKQRIDALFPEDPWKQLAETLLFFERKGGQPGHLSAFRHSTIGAREPSALLNWKPGTWAHAVGQWLIGDDKDEFERLLRKRNDPERLGAELRALFEQRVRPAAWIYPSVRPGRPRKGQVYLLEVPLVASLERLDERPSSRLVLPADLLGPERAPRSKPPSASDLRAVRLPATVALGKGIDVEPGDWIVVQQGAPYPEKPGERDTYLVRSLVRSADFWLLARLDEDRRFRGTTREGLRIETPEIDPAAWKKLVAGLLLASLRRET